MATLTTHLLNGVDGTHASGVLVQLLDKTFGKIVFQTETETGGRLSHEIKAETISSQSSYELVFDLNSYWSNRDLESPASITEIVLRFRMEDPKGSYHMPVIISPHGYSTWKSS